MQFGESIEGVKCARCYGLLTTPQSMTLDIVYEGGLLFHRQCSEQGERQLQKAERRAREMADRFGF